MTGNGARGRGPLGDDELGRALSEGLSRAVDARVDTEALLRGARTGARRIEHRRTVVRRGVVTLVVVAMLPLGVQVLRGSGLSASDNSTAAGAAPEAGSAVSAADAVGGAGGAAASSSRASAPRVAGSAATTEAPKDPVTPRSPGPAASPESGIQYGAVKGTLLRDAGEVVVPDVALLRADDLGLTSVTAGAQVVGARAVRSTVVDLCGDVPGDALAAGGRSLSWDGTAASAPGWSVVTSVRVFRGSAATDQLASLRRTVGTCPQSPGVSRETIAGLPGDDVLLAVLPARPSGDVPVVGVLRSGRVTVGVEVVVPAAAGTDEAARRSDGVARVRALLTRADARVATFATAAEADPSLA